MNQLKRLFAVTETRLIFFIATLVFLGLLGFCFAAWRAGEDVSMRAAAVGGGLMVLVQSYRRQR